MCASSWPLILSGCRFISPFYVSLGHSTVSAKCRLHLWVKSEDFFTFTIFSWDFTIPCTLISDLFLVLSIPLFFFIPFIMIVGWMVHINSIRSPFHLVLGSPIPILAISHGIILWFIESPGFKIVKPLIITLVEVLSCCYGFGFCCLLLLNCWKYRSFFSPWIGQTSCSCKNFSILGICLSPFCWCYYGIVLLSSIMNELPVWGFYYCVPIIPIPFNGTIEIWVWT